MTGPFRPGPVDLLQLPEAVWASHIFPLLSSADKSALRRACKAATRLCDAFATTASFMPGRGGDSGEPTASGQPPSRAVSGAAAGAGACLAFCLPAMLPRLCALTAVRLGGPGALLPVALLHSACALLDDATAPLGTVRSLQLHVSISPNTGGLQPQGISRLAQLLPGLASLDLRCRRVPTDLGRLLAQHCTGLERLTLCSEVLEPVAHPADDMENHSAVRLLGGLQSLACLHSMRLLPYDLVRLNSERSVLPCMAALRPFGSRLKELTWDVLWSWEGLQLWLDSLTALTRLTLGVVVEQQPPSFPMMLRHAGGAAAAATAQQQQQLQLLAIADLDIPALVITPRVWHHLLARLPKLRRLRAGYINFEEEAAVSDDYAVLETLPLLEQFLVGGAEAMLPGFEERIKQDPSSLGYVDQWEALPILRALPAVRVLQFGVICIFNRNRPDRLEAAALAAELTELDALVGRAPERCVGLKFSMMDEIVPQLLCMLGPVPNMAPHVAVADMGELAQSAANAAAAAADGTGNGAAAVPPDQALARAFATAFPNTQYVVIRNGALRGSLGLAAQLQWLCSLPQLRRVTFRYVDMRGLPRSLWQCMHELAVQLEGGAAVAAGGTVEVVPELSCVVDAAPPPAAGDAPRLHSPEVLSAEQLAAHPHVRLMLPA